MPSLDQPRPATPSSRAARALVCLCRLYALSVAALCLLLWTTADVWWPVTVLMYAPRWVFGLPLALLLPAALLLRPQALRWLLLGAVLWLWPLMDLCLPWRLVFAGEPAGPNVRVLTCNIHYQQLDVAGLRGLLNETRADVMVFQYWSSRYENELFEPGAFHVHRDGEFFIASRYPIREVQCLSDQPLAVRYSLEAPGMALCFVNLHLATPRDGLLAVAHKGDSGIAELEVNIARRRAESAEITAWLGDVNDPLLLAGDFNTTVESAIFRAYWSKYTDAFTVAGVGWGPTQFSTRRTATRIDHILAGPDWRCRRCWVGPFVGSEHRPVIADLEWVGQR